jgi:hypothetical protein
MRPKGRLNTDHAISLAALLVSTVTGVAVAYFTLVAGWYTQDRQAVDAGSQTEAAFVQACLDYETFVIDQYRAGLSDD